MTGAAADSLSGRPLSQWLAAGRGCSLKDRLVLVQCLARQVQTLHHQGRTHRAIGIEEVTVDQQLRPQLPPPAGPRQFGGDQSDPEFCPPELTGETSVVVPAAMEKVALGKYEAEQFDGHLKECLRARMVIFSGLKIDAWAKEYPAGKPHEFPVVVIHEESSSAPAPSLVTAMPLCCNTPAACGPFTGTWPASIPRSRRVRP